MFLKYEIIVWKLFMTVENIPYFRRNKIYPDTLYQSRTNWQNCFKQKKTSVQAKNIISSMMVLLWRQNDVIESMLLRDMLYEIVWVRITYSYTVAKRI